MIIPAIDLIGGKTVRLFQGNYGQARFYAQKPVELVRLYAAAKSPVIHIVDLDGARDSSSRQTALIKELAEASDAEIQTGGGIRSGKDIADLIDAGVSRVIIGSLAVEQPELVRTWFDEFGSERIVLALDVAIDENGTRTLPTRGWRKGSGESLENILARYDGQKLRHVLCTDISRDGTMEGSNSSLYSDLAKEYPSIKWQASGGIGSLDDIRQVCTTGASGIIVGRALLDGKFTIGEAQRCWQGE